MSRLELIIQLTKIAIALVGVALLGYGLTAILARLPA